MGEKITYNGFMRMAKQFREAGDLKNEFGCLYNAYQIDKERARQEIIQFRLRLQAELSKGRGNSTIRDLVKSSYLVSAKDYFDDFCIYIELDRPLDKRFYLPRRKQLLPIVEALQDLADGKLELLAISLPPGVGKTTLAIFFLCWLAGRNPDEPILGGSHSMSFLDGVYNECLRVINGGEYLWGDVFKGVPLCKTNAKDMRIDLGRHKRFETLEFTSVGAGNAGKVRAVQLLYCDDLVDGIETAMSRDRLEKLWTTYTTDLRQRKQGDHCKELHIATRWSLHDVIGKLQLQYGNSDKAKFISVPALDEYDESNFDYPFGVGFTTEFYHDQRETMDDASWRALYMNEPIEREGLLIDEKELKRYFELPDGEPDAILAVCDTKTSGSDYCVLPIGYKYGDLFYIEKIVCENFDMGKIELNLISALADHNVQMARFESNVAGGKIAESVQNGLKEKKSRCSISTKYTTANKETKIVVNAPWIKEHCVFKDNSVIGQDKEYRLALNFLCGYSVAGKNKLDDVPDAFAQFAEFVNSLGESRAVVKRRPW